MPDFTSFYPAYLLPLLNGHLGRLRTCCSITKVNTHLSTFFLRPLAQFESHFRGSESTLIDQDAVDGVFQCLEDVQET